MPRRLIQPVFWAVIGPKDGYVTEVWPGEAQHWRRNLAGAFGPGRRLVGEYLSEQRAKDALADAVAERDGERQRGGMHWRRRA